VVAEAQRRLDFRDPHSFSLLKALPVDCPGVDHIDFSADGSYLVATCEFSAKLVKVDLRSRAVVGYLKLAGSSPQDIKLDAAGQVFYVADRTRGGSTRLRPRHSGRSDSCPPARTPTASIPVATGGRSTSPIVVPGRSP
jgi:DNA-binding beta-propeller fold protein YncE